MSKKRGGISLYARRFHNLLVQLEKKGMSQVEIARRMGVSQGYISKWRKLDGNGLQDIGSLTIERVIKGLRIRGEWFTDDYPEDEVRPIELYSFDEAKKNRQIDELNQLVRSLSETLNEHTQALRGVKARLENLEDSSASQNARRSK